MKRYLHFEKLHFPYLVISIFYFCTLFIVSNATETLFEDISDESYKLRVTHYDCFKMEKNKKMYALTQVFPCKIIPEIIQMVDTHVTLYQRSYRTFIKAFM